jgi:hypothetical protein
MVPSPMPKPCGENLPKPCTTTAILLNKAEKNHIEAATSSRGQPCWTQKDARVHVAHLCRECQPCTTCFTGRDLAVSLIRWSTERLPILSSGNRRLMVLPSQNSNFKMAPEVSTFVLLLSQKHLQTDSFDHLHVNLWSDIDLTVTIDQELAVQRSDGAATLDRVGPGWLCLHL